MVKIGKDLIMWFELQKCFSQLQSSFISEKLSNEVEEKDIKNHLETAFSGVTVCKISR